MATLFDNLGAAQDAADCHRQVISICRKLGT
jgi:hypothetical protein